MIHCSMTASMWKGFWTSVTAPYSGSGNPKTFPMLKSDGKSFIPNRFSSIHSKNKNVFWTEIFFIWTPKGSGFRTMYKTIKRHKAMKIIKKSSGFMYLPFLTLS